MKTFYFVDFENVHNNGIKKIGNLLESDYVYIFTTENAGKINFDIQCLNNNIKTKTVPAGKQSLDKHLISYLGYIIGCNGDKCEYIIISNDKGYDAIIDLWRNEIKKIKISRRALLGQKGCAYSDILHLQVADKQQLNHKISSGMYYRLNGDDRTELNLFMQKRLGKKYKSDDVNKISSCVVAHCNDDRILLGIHNELKINYCKYDEVFMEVKEILGEYIDNRDQRKR